MLCGAFGAFCACAAENPSDRSATEAKRDSVFIGDFMVDLWVGLARVYEPRERYAQNPVTRILFPRVIPRRVRGFLKKTHLCVPKTFCEDDFGYCDLSEM